jgi:MFS family permease
MVPPAWFRVSAFSAGNAAGFFLTAALFGAVFFMAQYMQAAFGAGPLGAGLRLLPWTGTLFVVSPLAGRLVDRVGERPLVVAGLGLQAVGMVWISLVSRGAPGYGELVVPLAVAGCGVSMALPASQSASVGALPRAAVGLASGVYGMMRQLGGAVGVAVLGAVFAAGGGYASASAGFTRAFAASGVLSLLGAVAGLCMGAGPGAGTAGPVARPEPVEELR